MGYVQDVPPTSRCSLRCCNGPVPPTRVKGDPASPGCAAGKGRPWGSGTPTFRRGSPLDDSGSSGKPGTAGLSVQRLAAGAPHRQAGAPGEIHWAVFRWNRDVSEPRYCLSDAPEDTPLETLAYVGGSRWRIETEFETEEPDVGLDEYETRTPYQVRGRLRRGWRHHIALCLLAGALLLTLQQY